MTAHWTGSAVLGKLNPTVLLPCSARKNPYPTRSTQLTSNLEMAPIIGQVASHGMDGVTISILLVHRLFSIESGLLQ
jgi:hypothetical protein